MKRQIRWTEKTADGDKVDIRVSFHGKNVKWQFKGAGMKEWRYNQIPTDEQWDALELRVKNRYQRGHVSIDKTLEQVRKLRQA